MGDQKLKVMGYAGMKFLSETMIWTRAPADLKKCSDDQCKSKCTTDFDNCSASCDLHVTFDGGS